MISESGIPSMTNHQTSIFSTRQALSNQRGVEQTGPRTFLKHAVRLLLIRGILGYLRQANFGQTEVNDPKPITFTLRESCSRPRVHSSIKNFFRLRLFKINQHRSYRIHSDHVELAQITQNRLISYRTNSDYTNLGQIT